MRRRHRAPAQLAIGLGLAALGLAALVLVLQPAGAAQLAGMGRVYSRQLPGRNRNEALLGTAVSADGRVWVSDQGIDAVVVLGPGGSSRRIALAPGSLRDIENRASYVWAVGALYAAPDGSVYVGEDGALGRITSAGVRTYRIASGRYGSPADFTAGPDGAIWFTEVNRPYIGRFDPATGGITEFADGTGAHGKPAGGIAGGPDGRLWYTLPSYLGNGRGELGSITTSGRASVYRPKALVALLQGASGIVADRGSLWVLGSRLEQAPRGQLQSALLRVTPGPRRVRVREVGTGLGDATGSLTLAGGRTFYAVGGALGDSGEIVSVTEGGTVRHYGHANGQVSQFDAGANLAPLAAAPDGSVWLGADGGVLEHLLPAAPAPCVVPSLVGYNAAAARARLRRSRCVGRAGAVTGPADTPAIVTAQRIRADTVLNPRSAVPITVRRGVPYPCDPTDASDPELTVLRIGCRSALRLFHLVYERAVHHGTARADGFRCRYLKGTAIPAMGGGEVRCRGRDRRGRPMVADMFYAPPR